MSVHVFKEDRAENSKYFVLKDRYKKVELIEVDAEGKELDCGAILAIKDDGITFIGAYRGNLPRNSRGLVKVHGNVNSVHGDDGAEINNW